MSVEYVDELPEEPLPQNEIYDACAYAHKHGKKAKMDLNELNYHAIKYRSDKYADYHNVKAHRRKIGNFIYVWFD